MGITRNMSGARALVVGAGLALALAMGAAPTPAMAAGRVGTTKVMVRTEIDNVEFKVPTVIPFVAKADGTLQGPSEDATTIDNHSAYGIHVTNMKIDAMNTWTIAADAKAGTAQNSIDFKVGPDGALQNASAAMQETGLDLSKNAAFDMGYQGIAGGTDKIKLKTSGNVARVTRDIFRVTGEGDQVATITWTVEPGAHTASGYRPGRHRQHPSVWASHGLCPARTGTGRHASDGRSLGARPRRPRGTVGADRRQTMALGSRCHSSRRGDRRPRSAHQTQPETKHG